MIRELVSNRELENFTNQFGNKRTNLTLNYITQILIDVCIMPQDKLRE